VHVTAGRRPCADPAAILLEHVNRRARPLPPDYELSRPAPVSSNFASLRPRPRLVL